MSEAAAIPQIHDQTLISRSESLLAALVREQIVMMDIGRDRFYGLDDIGSDVWHHLQTPRRFDVLVDALAAEYDADRPTIAEDMRKLLSEMTALGMVQLG
jgi:hypothetical protein